MAAASQSFDAIVIGTGQAGPSLAARLAGAGMRVAIIERGKVGGTCVNTGCIPTKTLVASAAVARAAQRAAEFGVSIDGLVSVDMKKVKARKDQVSGDARRGNEEWLQNLANLTFLRGQAKFDSPREVRVGDEVLAAEKIFVNVGGRAATPSSIRGLDAIPFWTNSSIMDVDFVPPHLIIVGGSYIGLEFAQMYRRFGSQVTVIEMSPRLIAREDEDVSEAIRGIFENEGIAVRTNAKCIALEKGPAGVRAGVDCKEGSPKIDGSHLLLAVGRVPNTNDLGLDRAGVKTDARGYIVVDDQLRTNVEGIWALGDCNGRGAFTHTAYNDFEIVAANLLDNDPRRVTDRIETYALFIEPPLGRAGMTETAAKAAGRKILVGKRPMTKVKRAVEKGETQGFMKVVVDAESKQILGAAILGTGGDEVVHVILDVMYARAPYTLIQRAMHIHPTVSELLPTVFGELQPA
jgi:pyruvate/2-oxoglutarate dehydrogenase complex dihydrolipoamide dehydrogenase (E3) component